MSVDLFAGIPVRDHEAAQAWYTRLLGAEPAFLPNATEAVWQLDEHRFVYVDVRPEHAGHAMHTLFVSDFDARLADIADRGIEPTERETYANGTRKAVFRDPDGNEIGFGGAPAEHVAANHAVQQPGDAGSAAPSVVRLYAGDDGQSHFEELQLSFEDRGDRSALVEPVPGSGILVRRFEAERTNPWHHAPGRYAVFTLCGAVDISVGDGTLRRISVGDVLLAEDVSGQGHETREVGPEPRVSVFVPLMP